MAMNRIQFQRGLSLPAFLAHFGAETQCEEALELSRWPHGFHCPGCGKPGHYLLKVGKHKTFQCKSCRVQTSLIAGTLFQNTHLPLRLWFLAIYLISQAKAGRGSGNKIPFVAAISLSEQGRPLRIKLAPVPGFTRKAIAEWATEDLLPGSIVTSDGLACFAGVSDAGCFHRPMIAGGRKPKDLPEFNWINTVLGNLKTSLGGAYHSFDFAKYGIRYLGAFVYRFNRRFHPVTLPMRLVSAATACGARSATWLRQAEESC